MAIIYTYPIKGTPASGNDLIIISDSADENITKQIKVSQLPGGSSSGVTDIQQTPGSEIIITSSNGDGTGTINIAIGGATNTSIGGIKLGFTKDAANRNYPLLATANPNYQGYVSIDEMTGASLASGGLAGLVPSSLAGDQAKFLRADGTWATATGVNVVANPAAGGSTVLTALTVGNTNYSVGTVTSVAVTGPLTTSVTTSGVPNSPITSTGTIGIPAAGASSDGYLLQQDWNTFNSKQDGLVSGTTIKTINNQTILGAGDLTITSTGVSSLTSGNGTISTGQAITQQSSQTGAVSINSFAFAGGLNVGHVPSFTGEDNSNSFLRADGSWASPAGSAVTSFTNTNGTFISAGTANTNAVGAVTTGVIDLSATGLSQKAGGAAQQFLRGDNIWAIPNLSTGVSSIAMDNAVAGAISFSGSGVSQLGNTFTFSAGDISSVGLTMPTAFAVANSPLTSNGTISVTTTGGSSGEFLNYDGIWETPSYTTITSSTQTTNNTSGRAITVNSTQSGTVTIDSYPFKGGLNVGHVPPLNPELSLSKVQGAIMAGVLLGDGTWAIPDPTFRAGNKGTTIMVPGSGTPGTPAEFNYIDTAGGLSGSYLGGSGGNAILELTAATGGNVQAASSPASKVPVWSTAANLPPTNTLDPSIITAGSFNGTMRGVQIAGITADGTGSITNPYVLEVSDSNSTFSANAVVLIQTAVPHSPSSYGGPKYILFKSGSSGIVSGGIEGGTAVTDSPKFFAGSDYRLKTNINSYHGGLEKISNLRPVTYEEKANLGQVVEGFIAHEVQEHIPKAVNGVKDAVDKDGEDIIQTLSIGAFMVDVVSAIKELKDEVDSLKAEIRSLKK